MANLRVGATTHTGQVRPANEDSLLITPTVFVVADASGGLLAAVNAFIARTRFPL